MSAAANGLFLGIDIGTFETKGVLVDCAGVVVAQARRPHTLATPVAGHAEHDAETVWWQALTEIAQALITDPAVAGRVDCAIRAVGVSAIGPCVLPIDANLNPLRPAILYGVDTRASAQIETLTERLGSPAILARAGNSLTSQSAGPKILWIKENEPAVYDSAAYFVTSQTFLVARLTGEIVIDHGTAAYFHPLYDLAKQAWNVTGCEDFISVEQLPRLAWATDIAGHVTDAAAAQTGIPAGTPVIVGTTDAPAEAVGSSVVHAGDLMLMYGSSTYMIEVLDEPITSDVLWSAPFVFPGSYVLAAGTATAGTLTHWLGDVLELQPGGESPQRMFSALLQLANDSEPGARGLLFLPYFSGERTPIHDANARGIIAGLTLNHTRADIARAMMEGIGHSIADALNAFVLAGKPPTRIYAVGGGTKNPLFLQTVSDLTDSSQIVVDTEGAAFGDAALAAFGTGHLTSRAEIASWCHTGRTVVANVANQAQLRADHDDFHRLYATTKELINARATKETV
ncbi:MULTISPECIES: FGGY-family carbohydrate kinase [unclassified Cryobacterium]|uniref:FGGY-family carbohydrate kinase n=1 Tax=unclassified Cryobacterium TaxID=2649013 RepID=UPI000CE3A966|nr:MULTISPECIES: FGGY family carbohydrate kinase [unclassified Cryobacterium]